MRCYICYRLKAELRATEVKDAELVVNGYSVCPAHAATLPATDWILHALDRARS